MEGSEAVGRTLSRKERRQLKERARVDNLKPLLDKLSQDDDDRLDAVRELRSRLETVPIDDIVQTGFVPRLVQLAQECNNQKLQFESLWVLADMTSADDPKRVQAIVDVEFIDVMKGLLFAERAVTREQAASVLGKVALVSTEMRDFLLNRGVVLSIVKMLNLERHIEQVTFYDEHEKTWKLRSGKSEQPTSVIQNVARCLANLCAGTPRPVFGQAFGMILNSFETFLASQDKQVISQACRGLSYLEYVLSENVAMVVKCGICSRLVDFLEHTCDDVRSLSAKAVRQIARGSPHGMMAVLICEPVPALKDMLECEQTAVQIESCAILRIVLAVGHPHVKEVIDAGCVPSLASLLCNPVDEVQWAAACALGVFSARCTPEQMDDLTKDGCAGNMVKLLETAVFGNAIDVGIAVLEFISNAFAADRSLRTDRFRTVFKQTKCEELIQKVMEANVDDNLRKRAEKLLALN